MKCPNCGAEMQSEAYRRMMCPGYYEPQICFFCPNGDFGTDYAVMTKALTEIESAYKWNAQREATPWEMKEDS